MKDQVTDLYRKDYVPTMYTDMVWYAVSEYEGCVEKFLEEIQDKIIREERLS